MRASTGLVRLCLVTEMLEGCVFRVLLFLELFTRIIDCTMHFIVKTSKMRELYKQICPDKCANLSKFEKCLEKHNFQKNDPKRNSKPK